MYKLVNIHSYHTNDEMKLKLADTPTACYTDNSILCHTMATKHIAVGSMLLLLVLLLGVLHLAIAHDSAVLPTSSTAPQQAEASHNHE